MDKLIESSTFSHLVNINERKNITITGIKNIESFDSEEFILISNLGTILLKGQNLEIIKLDTIEGKVSIKGEINSLAYVDDIKGSKETSLFSKIFK